MKKLTLNIEHFEFQDDGVSVCLVDDEGTIYCGIVEKCEECNMRKFKCINCHHVASFSSSNEEYPKCIVCDSLMLDIIKAIEDDEYAKMYKNIEYFGIDGVIQKIDEHFGKMPLTRCAYRKILHETVARYNLNKRG